MWRRQEEPKVSPTPQNVVVAPQPGTNSSSLSAQHTPPPQAAAQQPVSSSLQTPVPAAPKTAVSIVCKGIKIHGQVSGNEDLQIDGEVSGTVELPAGRVMIGPEGRMAGNIHAREIIVRGELKGNLRAAERILVGQTGRWEGDSVSPRLAIEEGAAVSGKIEVVGTDEKKTARGNFTKSVSEDPKAVKPTPVSTILTNAAEASRTQTEATPASVGGANGAATTRENEVSVTVGAGEQNRPR